MKRLKRTHRLHIFRDVAVFFCKNTQLLFLIVLILGGAVLGAVIYTYLPDSKLDILEGLMSYSSPPNDFISGCTAVVSSSFFLCILLILLFLFGLTPYGCPLILIVPCFWGFWMGIAECFAYRAGGFGAVALTVLPYILISSIAILVGGAQALRMSFLFSRQLLPAGAHCGGMWQDFKMYLLRFLLCVLIALTASIVRVLLQML